MDELDDLRGLIALARRRDEQTDPGPPPSASEITLRAGFDAEQSRGERWRARARRALVPLGVAAGAACAALGALGYHALVGGGAAATLSAMEFTTAAGESTTVQLNDGSVVRLGPRSRLEITPGDEARQVMLEGRAFFAVAPDASRPFRVVTPAGSAHVLGTRFELQADSSNLRLVVVEGSVMLAAADSELRVVGGEMAEVSKGHALGIAQAPGLAVLSAEWMGNFLVFRETALREAAVQIAEIYGVEVRIADPALLDRTLTVWFSSRPLEEVLTVVCSVIDAPCRVDERVVTIGVGTGRT